MPVVGLTWPIAAAIASIVGAGATTGVGLYEASQTPSQPKLPTSVTQTPLTGPQNAQTQAAVSQQLPTLQSLTGGSVSPEYAASFGATQSGNANNPQASGDVQAAINQFFGLGASGSSGLTAAPGSTSPGGNPLTDLLSKVSIPGGGGGGGGSDFVSNLLSGSDFHGLVGA